MANRKLLTHPKHARKLISLFELVVFSLYTLGAPVSAQILSAPQGPVGSTLRYQPTVLLGLKIHPENPLLLDFIVDRGQTELTEEEFRVESEKLVKYFLAALTIPDKEVWVNLSPYEKGRIIPDLLARTEMGKQMLEQDYVLKQLSASLTHPDTELGRTYWQKVERRSPADRSLRGSTLSDENSPGLSKVWIVPGKARVLESDGIVVIDDQWLRVMMQDELPGSRFPERGLTPRGLSLPGQNKIVSSVARNDDVAAAAFRSLILPKIEQEVNDGRDFASVRQVYNSVILAAWYKQALKESLLGKIYTDKGKVAGVTIDDAEMKERVYQQYLTAFQKGAYNIIKEEEDALTGDMIPRKYFSGGVLLADFGNAASSTLQTERVARTQVAQKLTAGAPTLAMVTILNAEQKTEQDAVASAATINPFPVIDLGLLENGFGLQQQKSLTPDEAVVGSLEYLRKQIENKSFPGSQPLDALEQRLLLIVALLDPQAAQALFGSEFNFGQLDEVKIGKGVQTVMNFQDTDRQELAKVLRSLLRAGRQKILTAPTNSAEFRQLLLTPSALRAAAAFAIRQELGFNTGVHASDQQVMEKMLEGFAVSFGTRNLKPYYDERDRRTNQFLEYFNLAAGRQTAASGVVKNSDDKTLAEVLESVSLNETANKLVRDLMREDPQDAQKGQSSYQRTASEMSDPQLAQALRDLIGRESPFYQVPFLAIQDLEGESFLKGFLDIWTLARLDTNQAAQEYYQSELNNVFTDILGNSVFFPLNFSQGILSREQVEAAQKAKSLLRELFSRSGVEKMNPGGASAASGVETPAMSRPAVVSAPVTPVGGIDFDPSNLDLQIKRNGRGVPLPLGEQNWQEINIQGLYPVIIQIMPVNAQTLPLFLGRAALEPAETTAVSLSPAS